MSASMLVDRTGYYRMLESSQKAVLDITAWMQWFFVSLLNSLHGDLQRIDRVLATTRFWQLHQQHGLLREQTKVLNRLFDGGERGFKHAISVGK